jgi:O-antigen/teichoic acid export membrane protein
VKSSLSFAVIVRVVGSLIGIASSFISIRLYNLYVSKEEYGVILVGLGIIGYLQLISGGFRMVVNQRMLAEPEPEAIKALAEFGQVLQTYFLLFVLVGGMIVMAGYSQVPSTRALGLPFLVFIATGAAAAATFHAASQLSLLVAVGEQVKSTILQILWGLFGLFFLWLSFFLGGGIWAFPISIGFGALTAIIGAKLVLMQTSKDVPVVVWKPAKDFGKRFKGLWRAAFDCLHNQIATTLIFSADLVMVGLLVGPGAAAVYGLVTRVMVLSRQVLQSLSEAAWPRLTQELDGQRKAIMMRKVDRLNAWSVGCWYGAMAATLLPFLGSLVRHDWVASPILAGLIVARSFIISLASPHAYGLMSAGRFRELAKLSQFEAIMGLILGITLSYAAGVVGTALAFLLATCSMSAWQMTREYFRFAHDTHWMSESWAIWWRGLVGIGCGLALAMTAWEFEQKVFAAHGWTAILAGGIGYGIPMGLILLGWRMVGRVP